MEELKELFLELGYNENEYVEIVNTYSIIDMKAETLLKKIKEIYDFLISLGYSKEEVIKMTKSLPQIYGLSIENINQKIEDMEELGYSREEIIKMTKSLPFIYGLRIENINQKIEDMEELGYSREEVIKMTKNLPQIYGLSIENIKQKIEDMEELGYSREEVIKMTKSLPQIYSLSIENIKQKIEDMEELGYSREEVIKMTIGLPTIFGLSIENIKQKVEFYNYIGLHSLAVVEPKKLIQSTKLSYARYMFFKEKGIVIDETSYRKLFVGQKQFEKQYGLTKNEILQKYPYEEWQASANEAKREKAKEDSKVQSDGERKEEVIQRIKGKQERIFEQEEEISKLEIELQSKKNALE